MKHYVIFKGIDPKTNQEVENIILHLPWNEVEPYIKGVSGAKYKGFKTKEAALAAIAGSSKDNNLTTVIDGLVCYVDGSFNEAIGNYGYGLVCFRNGKLVHYDAGKGKNKEAVVMRQIGGELSGTMKALLFAKKEKDSRVTIFHDYMGVAKHATGEWKRTSEFSKLYYAWMQRFFQENPSIQVEFQHVAAHTGDLGNELADGLAKLSVGIEPNKVFFKKATEVNMSIDSLYVNI